MVNQISPSLDEIISHIDTADPFKHTLHEVAYVVSSNLESKYLPKIIYYSFFDRKQTEFATSKSHGFGLGLLGLNIDPSYQGSNKFVATDEAQKYNISPFAVAHHEHVHGGSNMHGKDLSEWLTRQITEDQTKKMMPNNVPAYIRDRYLTSHY